MPKYRYLDKLPSEETREIAKKIGTSVNPAIANPPCSIEQASQLTGIILGRIAVVMEMQEAVLGLKSKKRKPWASSSDDKAQGFQCAHCGGVWHKQPAYCPCCGEKVK